MRTRDYRRNQEEKKKKRAAKHNWFLWFDKTPALIGQAAHTPKQCSCRVCGNPRKHWKEKTIQEKRNDYEEIR